MITVNVLFVHRIIARCTFVDYTMVSRSATCYYFYPKSYLECRFGSGKQSKQSQVELDCNLLSCFPDAETCAKSTGLHIPEKSGYSIWLDQLPRELSDQLVKEIELQLALKGVNVGDIKWKQQ